MSATRAGGAPGVGGPEVALEPSRLAPGDAVRVAASALWARPLRVVLSALGIAVGIAAMVAVVGISASSREEVNRQLAALGTNLLTIGPGQTLTGEQSRLPQDAVAMVERIGPVTDASGAGAVDDVAVYRTDGIDEGRTNGLAVLAADLDLPSTVGATLASGRWLDEALAGYPTVVLGARAAELLGITAADGSVAVWLGGAWFTVVGVLDPVALAPELDSAALVGGPVAADLLGFDGSPTVIYERSRDDAVEDVRAVLPATANPAAPEEVSVSRPSDALAAQAATDDTLTALLLALGGVALLVGGIGVANTMVIAVMERRSEVGLRRALGATRRHVRAQFVVESVVLATIGGVAGALLGGTATVVFAAVRGWPAALPVWVLAAAAAATVLVGALAGAYPASRAARLAPTAALTAI